MTHDVLIVGGGLAGSLAAWRLLTEHPALRVSVLEAGGTLGGNHTWSFHDADVSDRARGWLEPLIVARWPSHEVRFPRHARILSGGYLSVTSERLHAVIAPFLGARARFNTPIETLTPTAATLSTGETLRARLVIDARGGAPPQGECGWQTFFGQDLVLERDHGLQRPVLMDATVAQDNGFRFVYLLPWSARRVLVEDTRYSDDARVDVDHGRRQLARYATARGWVVQRVAREEHGALPIPLSGNGASFWQDDTIRIGVRAGLFHPTTGYSLPDAAAVAELLPRLAYAPATDVYGEVKRFAMQRWSSRAFFRMLNRMLFRATEPESRINVLDQFYRRPEALIERFYADRLTWLDRVRLLSGRPPVPVTRALVHALAGR